MIHVYHDTTFTQAIIIRMDYVHPVADWDEYTAAVYRSYALADQFIGQSVYIVHNAQNVPMPKGNPYRIIQKAMQDVPPHVVYVIACISNLYAVAVVNFVVRNLAQVNVVFYKTIDLAYNRIQRDEQAKLSHLHRG
ncbi:MAG: hypothetical protein ACOYLB_00410 [Phototrophicaceae bacterium]